MIGGRPLSVPFLVICRVKHKQKIGQRTTTVENKIRKEDCFSITYQHEEGHLRGKSILMLPRLTSISSKQTETDVKV